MRFTRVTAAARTFASAALALVGSAGVASAQGTITGRVSAQGTGEPLQEARIILLGTSLFTSAAADGRYTLRNAPTGASVVRVIRVGYTESKKSVLVTAGQTVTLDFVMVPAVVKLAEVVTTATGETRKLELGNSISQINAADITSTQTIRSLSDLLTARAPGA